MNVAMGDHASLEGAAELEEGIRVLEAVMGSIGFAVGESRRVVSCEDHETIAHALVSQDA